MMKPHKPRVHLHAMKPYIDIIVSVIRAIAFLMLTTVLYCIWTNSLMPAYAIVVWCVIIMLCCIVLAYNTQITFVRAIVNALQFITAAVLISLLISVVYYLLSETVIDAISKMLAK